MAENERHESEDENSIATPLVLTVREYPNLGDLELSPIDGHTFRAPCPNNENREDEASSLWPSCWHVREEHHLQGELATLELRPLDEHALRSPWLRRWMHTWMYPMEEAMDDVWTNSPPVLEA